MRADGAGDTWRAGQQRQDAELLGAGEASEGAATRNERAAAEAEPIAIDDDLVPAIIGDAGKLRDEVHQSPAALNGCNAAAYAGSMRASRQASSFM
jgi:hypothetical protein